MNYENLQQLMMESKAFHELMAYELTYTGILDLNDDLIIEGRICFHRVNQMLDELERQQNGD